MGCKADREAHLQNCAYKPTSKGFLLLIAPLQDFGANCKLPIVVLGLVVSVWQHLITLRIRIATFIGIRHSLVQWKNAWETAAKYALLCTGETSINTCRSALSRTQERRGA